MPSYGIVNSLDGQESVPSSLGPLSTSLSGVTAFIRTILQAEPWKYCPNTFPKAWSQDDYELKTRGGGKKLCFGIMWDNEVVKPHPPLIRGMEITKKALEAAGHKGRSTEIKE